MSGRGPHSVGYEIRATAPLVWDWTPDEGKLLHREAQRQSLSLGRYRFTPHDAPRAEWGWCLQRPVKSGFNIVGTWRDLSGVREHLNSHRIDDDDENAEPV